MFNMSRAQFYSDIAFRNLNKPLVGSSETDILRSVQFSLYSNIGVRSIEYLVRLGDDDLQNLILQHETNMAQLSNEEKVVLVDICSQRYLNAVDMNIREYLRNAKIDSVRTESALNEAKILAIESDRKTLDTLQHSIALEAAKVTSTLAQFAVDGKQADYDVAAVAVEASKQKLNVSRARLDLLMAQAKAAEYQAQIIDMAYQKANVSVQLATIQSEIIEFQTKSANIDAQIAEIDAQIESLNSKVVEFGAKGIRAQAGVLDYEFKRDSNEVRKQEYDAELQTLTAQVSSLEAKRQTVEAQREEVLARGRELDSKIKDMTYQIAKVDVDIANIQIQTTEQELAESTMLEAAAAKTEAQAQAEAWPQRVAALQEKHDILKSILLDGKYYDRMLDADKKIIDGQVSVINSKSNLDVLTTDGEITIVKADAELKSKLSILKAKLAEGTRDAEIANATGQGKIWTARLQGSGIMANSKISAATTIAKADVSYNLIHSIGGA